MQEPKPGKHRAGKTFGQMLREEFCADNAFTVTLCWRSCWPCVLGGVLMIIGDADVRAQWASTSSTSRWTRFEASWDLVSQAYVDLFKGSIVDPRCRGTGTGTSHMPSGHARRGRRPCGRSPRR